MINTQLEEKLLPILRRRQLELAYVAPQKLGRLNFLYHRFVPWVKVAPWRVAFLWAVFLTLILRFVLGERFVTLASLLQKAF